MVPVRIVHWRESVLLLVLGLLYTLTAIPGTIANREHKVHNIVLYPDKQSWCTTRNITQVITEPGCKQVTIDNNVCVGACFSYSIPHTEPSDPGEIIGPYCDSCQPSEVSYRAVKMDCSEHSATSKTPYIEKHIQLIHNCSCTACEEQSAATGADRNHRQEQSLPASLSHQQQHHHHQVRPPVDAGAASAGTSAAGSDMIQDDIPEILEVVHYSENDTEPIRHTPVHEHQTHTGPGTSYLQQQQLNHYEHNSHTDNVKKLLHQKITKLLQSIEATNSVTDREQLVEMIRLIKGTSDRNWDELVDSLQSENAILDFDRLRTELVEGGEDEEARKSASSAIPAASAHQPAGAGDETDLPTINRVPHQHQQHPEDEEETDEEDEEEEEEEMEEKVKEDRHGHGGDGSAAKQTDDGSLAKELPHASPTDSGDHRRLMQHHYSAVRGHTGQTPGGSDNHHLHHQHHHQQQQQQQHHRQHVVGERIDAHHHLGWGPHGALVIRANEEDLEEHRSIQNGHEIQEKINIHAHELKPNHAGLVVSYDHRSARSDGTGRSVPAKQHDDHAHGSHVKHGSGQEQQQQHHQNHHHEHHQHHHHSQRHGQRTESDHSGQNHQKPSHGQEFHHGQQHQPGSHHPGSHGPAAAAGTGDVVPGVDNRE